MRRGLKRSDRGNCIRIFTLMALFAACWRIVVLLLHLPILKATYTLVQHHERQFDQRRFQKNGLRAD
jgi:hypothetical protein